MLRIRPVLVAFAALALGTGVLVGATAMRARADTTLCQYQVAHVGAGQYAVQNDEWDSSAPECVTTDGLADFKVASSSISNATDGAPGGYPSIFAGCHWGDCTTGGLAADPLLVADIGTGLVTSTWSTTEPGGSGNAYDVAYDIWINQTPTTSSAPDGTEVMVWLNHDGQVQPAGSVVASDVGIDGRRYDVWYKPRSSAADCVSFEMISPHTGVTGLDIGTLINYAVQHGYTNPSWYLISVEAGFEVWQGGAGLATKSFSVSLKPATPGGSSPGHR
jgi:hypothetical protein